MRSAPLAKWGDANYSFTADIQAQGTGYLGTIALVAGDVQYSVDGGVNWVNCAFTQNGTVIVITPGATALQNKSIVVRLLDQSDPIEWYGEQIEVLTFGNASAYCAIDISAVPGTDTGLASHIDAADATAHISALSDAIVSTIQQFLDAKVSSAITAANSAAKPSDVQVTVEPTPVNVDLSEITAAIEAIQPPDLTGIATDASVQELTAAVEALGINHTIEIVYPRPTLEGDQVDLVSGDDYLDAARRSIITTISSDDIADDDIVTMQFADIVATASTTVNSDVCIITVELSAEQTASLSEGSYPYRLIATGDTRGVRTLLAGMVNMTQY